MCVPGETAVIQQVRGYWQALRQNGALPRRDHLDPRGFGVALGAVCLLERPRPHPARFRLAGMALQDRAGCELRGLPLAHLFDQADHAALAQALDPVFGGIAILDLSLRAHGAIWRQNGTARLLVLPLAGRAGEPDLALGCLAGCGGPAPCRFRLSYQRHERLAPPPDLRRGHLRLVSSRG